MLMLKHLACIILKKFNSGIPGRVKSNDSAKNLHRLEDHNKLNNRFSAQLYNMLFLYNI